MDDLFKLFNAAGLEKFVGFCEGHRIGFSATVHRMRLYAYSQVPRLTEGKG